ncbi:hypothetical protein MUCCIDRAFT_108086 [Mucor lusitanicus CBS 277.49]|uniref:DNA damage-binding protein 1 n=2 Tax=Mucor circinelloides f. lusitanicus TaxID=29924 RepID=A0A162MQG0_MUCCL|nr:hypothetical protein MUCCIDRAFT_108086 [Mucor lusitanicus CBS 277.49]
MGIQAAGGSLEWLTVHPVTESNPNMLQSQLEQSTFGIINDAKLLSMAYQEDDDSSGSIMEQDHAAAADYQEMSYAKKTRRHARIQGNDVIVALSEYGKLVFITIIQDALTRRFETLAEVYLDSPGLEYTKKGKKLAIDPCGRAIAIASFQDHFDILILDKTTSRIHFDPIIGRGSEFEEGIIWQMEFLHTESDAMDRILLVLTVYNDVERLCRLVLYSIDASDMKNVTIEKISRLPLEKNTPLPLLLIPLSFQTEAFLLVTEQNVSYLKADDLACGNVLYPTSQIPRNLECPLFTAYAGMLNNYERYIYLGSSEGHLYRLGVDVWGEREVNIDWQPLDATSPISQAMCVLGRMDVEEPRGFRGTDVLLCAGESADNHVLAMCTSTLPFRRDVVQTIVNRAPLTDYQVADNFIGDQDAIITCSGQDLHGALSIVTHGIEATHMAQSSRYEWKGVSRLWQIKASVSLKEQVSCLVVSSLLDTRLLCAKDGHIKDITSSSNIEFNTETVYATSITINNYSLLLQVHVAGFSVIDVGSKEVLLDSSPLIGSDDRIEMAACWQQGDAVYVAFCMIRNSSFSLELVRIATHSTSSFSLSDKQIASEPLPYCPSCLECFNVGSKASLVVGTFQPSILIYTVENELLEQVQQVDLSLQEPGSFTVPYSAAILSSWLVFGLRQGSILCMPIDFEHESIYLDSQASQIIHVGQSAVDLVPCQDGMYALSGRLWKIACTVDEDIHLDRVLVPKFDFINAFCLFDCGLPTLYGERIALIADDKLHTFALSPDTQLSTRKIELKDTPRKIIYDKSLDYLIAITTRMENGDRKNFIRLVDLASGHILTDNQLLWTNTDYGRSDMVLSATEWSVQNKHKTYKYLCVGLGHPKEPFHSFRSGMSARVSKALMDRGTLLLFRLKTNNKFPLKRVWDQEKLPGGVFAICPYSAGLLFSAGSHLYLYRLDPATGRLVEVAHKALQYLITSIHEEGGRICVTFHNDSVSFFEFDPLLKTYDFLKSDVVSRSIHHSLMLNNRLAVGVSQSGGMVALYDDPNDKSFERRLKCLFNFHYADIIVKPKLATLRTQTHVPSYLLPWNQDATVVKPIVGCTVSGGMIHVFRISEPLYQLLHALSDELIEFEPTKPLLGNTDNFRWFCKLSGAEQATIHGDLVEAYLRLSPDEQLAVITDEHGQIKMSIQTALSDFITGDDSDEDPIDLLEDILQSFENFK